MLNTSRTISTQEAYQIGNTLGVNWNVIDISQFRRGLEVELEHGLINNSSNVTNNDMLLTAKIALAHLNELSDYYTRLDMIENAKLNVGQTNSFNQPPNDKFSLVAGVALGVGTVFLANYLLKKKREN